MKFNSGKVYLLLIVVGILLIAWKAHEIPSPTSEVIDIYIISGQSNAVGYNNTDSYEPAPFPVALSNQPNIMFWAGSNSEDKTKDVWTHLKVGVSGISKNSFGPEISFGHDIAVSSPNTQIAIIKYAVGGTGIARSKNYNDYIPGFENFNDKGINWHYPDKKESSGILYENLLNNINAALNSLD